MSSSEEAMEDPEAGHRIAVGDWMRVGVTRAPLPSRQDNNTISISNGKVPDNEDGNGTSLPTTLAAMRRTIAMTETFLPRERVIKT